MTVGPPVWREIVGIVGDVRQNGLLEGITPQVYAVMDQIPYAAFSLVVRAKGAARLAPVIRQRIRSIDPNQAVLRTVMFPELIGNSVARQRFLAWLLAAFSGVALVLSATGIYGVISCVATQRTHEIAMRMALGADRGDVLRMIVGQGLKLALAGIADNHP